MSAALATLQRELKRLILGDSTIPAHVLGSDAPDTARRLNIYSTAYVLRMREALAHNLERFCAHVGAQEFAMLADAYITAHPSTHFSVRAVGEHLAEWLREARPDEPWLAEFAQFEWRLAAAFDAPDAIPLDTAAFAAIEPSQWPSLTFTLTPSLRRLSLHTNAPALYRCITDGEPRLEGQTSAAASEWLIWRHELTTHYRSMNSSEAFAIDYVLEGYTFADLCAALAERDDSDDVPVAAASLLKRWLVDGLIVAVATRDDEFERAQR